MESYDMRDKETAENLRWLARNEHKNQEYFRAALERGAYVVDAMTKLYSLSLRVKHKTANIDELIDFIDDVRRAKHERHEDD